jgi:hypothetical protein
MTPPAKNFWAGYGTDFTISLLILCIDIMYMYNCYSVESDNLSLIIFILILVIYLIIKKGLIFLRQNVFINEKYTYKRINIYVNLFKIHI